MKLRGGRRGVGVAGWLGVCASTLAVGVWLGAGHAAAVTTAAPVAQPVAKVAPAAPVACIRALASVEDLARTETDIINRLRVMVNSPAAVTPAQRTDAVSRLTALNRWSGGSVGAAYAKDVAACQAAQGR